MACDCRTTSDEQPSIRAETAKQATDATDTGIGERLEQAKRLIQSARFADARSLLSDIIEQAPGAFFETEARYMLAVTYRYLKNYDQALATLDANEVSTSVRRGSTQLLVMLCGRTTEASEAIDRAQIRRQLVNQRIESYATGYLAELRSDAQIIELE